MRRIHLISSGIMAVLLLAASASAAPQAAQPVATEQVSGGMLTVTPNQPSVASRLSVSGPQGYEVTVWAENGGAVSVNLMAEGRFPDEEGGEAAGESLLDGRHLPDGRYKYEAIFYGVDGAQRAESAVFFVESGVAMTRSDRQSELREVRGARTVDPSGSGNGPGQEGLSVDDFIRAQDTAGDGETHSILTSTGNTSISLANAFGDWVFVSFDNGQPIGPRPFTVESDDQQVGIGTTNPQADLHIFRPGGNIRITDSDACPNPNASWEIEEDFGRLKFEVIDNCPGDSTGGKVWIHGNGNVGIGTNNPGEELEIAGGFPTIRFNDTSGTLQVWDIDADSGNFLVQDVTNLSVPFLIEPGTPNQTLGLSSDGRVGVGTLNPSAKLHVAGSGRIDGDVALGSSRTLKTGFGSVSAAEMLARVADLPLASWRYKSEDAGTRHIGPFAEDFQRLFGLGDGETISVIDAQGVTLAAIQGLQQALAAKDAETAARDARIAELESENAQLASRLAAIENRLDRSR